MPKLSGKKFASQEIEKLSHHFLKQGLELVRKIYLRGEVGLEGLGIGPTDFFHHLEFQPAQNSFWN